MIKRNFLAVIAFGLAIGTAVLPSALQAKSPNAIGHYGPTCNLTRQCNGGSTFCGWSDAQCKVTQLFMAP